MAPGIFAGTFLAALSRGKSFQEAGTLACQGASRVVTQTGPRLTSEGYKALKASF